MNDTEAQAKLEAQMALKKKHDEELEAFKATGDVGVLKAWGKMGFKQPAPQAVQDLKKNLGLSWRGLKTFIEKMNS